MIWRSAVLCRATRLLIPVGSLVFGACFLTGPSHLGGSYQLLKFGVDSVPVRLFELPSRDGQPTGCWYTLTEGTLQLTERPAHFRYELIYRDSCNDSILFTNVVEGTFDRTDDILIFIIPAQDTELRFPVEARGDLLVVKEDPSHVYTFVRGT